MNPSSAAPAAAAPGWRRSRRARSWSAAAGWIDPAAATAFVTVGSLPVLNETASAGHAVAGLGAMLVAAGGMLHRRSRPVRSLALCLAAAGLLALAAPRAVLVGFAAIAWVLYTVAGDRRAWAAPAGLLAGLLAAAATALPNPDHSGGAVLFTVTLAAVWVTGYVLAARRRRIAELLARQARLAEQELAETLRTVTAQRLELARELHDVIAHTLSIVTVQAGYAGLVVDHDAEAARRSLQAIEDAGRQSLQELRRLLNLLRDAVIDGPAGPSRFHPAAPEPAPGLAELDRLVRDTETAGVRVELLVSGTVRALPAGVELAAYRIVQEALTNVVKHAGTAQARLAVHHGEQELTVQITDAGGGSVTTARPGHGLLGMRERVELYGGTLSTHAVPGAGFTVTAVLPVPAVATAAEPQPQLR